MTTSVWTALAAAVTRDLAEALPDDQRFGRLLDALRAVLPFDAAAVLRLEGDVLVPVAARGLGDEVMGRRFVPAEQPRLARLLAAGGPLRFGADSTLPDPYDGLIDSVGSDEALLPVHDCMGAPLQIDGRPWGVITFDALAPGTFDDIGVPRLQELVAWVEAGVRAGAAVATLRERGERDARLQQQALQAERSRRTLAGRSAAMQALRDEIGTVAGTDLTVLVFGETGVGKELVAERLHAQSPRADRPLVRVNCAALPESLAESELFGHRKGAYTGALEHRAGLFELADGGTLFLDEVGELPLAVQAKLLRVLQSGELQRPGSDRTVRVDVRTIAATNRLLRDEVARGRFRADLYHRLSVFPLHVPPLRERGKDVLTLAGSFLDENQHRLGVRSLRLTPAAKAALLAHDWPGNVRELEHTIGRAALRAVAQQGRSQRWTVIDAEHLGLAPAPPLRGPGPAVPEPVPRVPGQTLRDATDAFQRRWLQDVLARHDGQAAAAAREAGMDRSNFARLLKRLEVRR
jgi:anaerobic nitric oxide reductase transcription regulator